MSKSELLSPLLDNEWKERTQRLRDACYRARMLLEKYCNYEDPNGAGPRAIAQAALAEVRQIHDHEISLGRESRAFRIEPVPPAEEWSFLPFESAFERTIGDYESQSALQILHLVEDCWLDQFIRSVGGKNDLYLWGQEPDWAHYEKATLRLSRCSVAIASAIHGLSQHRIRKDASLLDEMRFRDDDMMAFPRRPNPLASDEASLVNEVLAGVHAPNLVRVAGMTEVHATLIAIELARSIVQVFFDCIDRKQVLTDTEEWMDEEDANRVRNSDRAQNWHCHDEKMVNERIGELQSSAELLPHPTDLIELPMLVEAEYRAVRDKEDKRLVTSKLRRIPTPLELGFPADGGSERLRGGSVRSKPHSGRAKRNNQGTRNARGRITVPDAFVKLTAGLTQHHQWEEDSCLVFEAIGSNELGRRVGVSKGRTSDFFRKQFGGYAAYKQQCNGKTINHALALLNNHVPPSRLNRPLGIEPEADDDAE